MKKIVATILSFLLAVGFLSSCYLLEEDISEKISVGMNNDAFLELAEDQREYYQMGSYCFFKNCGKDYVVVIDYEQGTVREIHSFPSVTPKNKDFDKVQIGDDIFAVVDKVGVPKGSYTSGAISLTYKLRNNDVYTIYFNSNSDMTVSEIVYSPAPETSENNSSSSGSNGSGAISSEIKTHTMTATIDYGMYEEDKATVLLDYCNIFFNIYEYNLTTVVAGDVFEIFYVGEFVIQETYPGTVMTQYFTMKSMKIQKAFFIPITVVEREGGGLAYTVVEGEYNITKFASSNIISEDGTFRAPSYWDIGEVFYASCKASQKGNTNVQVEAIYDYYPREEDAHVCSLVRLEYVEPTCENEGLSVIGCTDCGKEYERTVIPTIPCEYDAEGICVMCGKEESVFVMPCCFCGSYTCTGCVED